MPEITTVAREMPTLIIAADDPCHDLITRRYQSMLKTVRKKVGDPSGKIADQIDEIERHRIAAAKWRDANE